MANFGFSPRVRIGRHASEHCRRDHAVVRLRLLEEQVPSSENGEVESALQVRHVVWVGVAGDVTDRDRANRTLVDEPAATACAIRRALLLFVREDLGGRGCGGCHNMGIKSEEQKKEQRAKGYKYQNNSCDECHTRHTFSKKEALNPKACQQCHMGYDHPQWEMWSSSKHGARYAMKKEGDLPEGAAAPTCQDCHMSDGNHENRTAWGFLGVRLPLPEDKQWAADQVTILKALGVLDPETGKPTGRLEVVKAADLARLTQEAWQTERDKMIKTCTKCHSKSYAREQLGMGDKIMQDADRLMAEAIEVVGGLYRDGIIKKPADYAFAYPDFLFFMQTGGAEGAKNLKVSHVDQVLFEMYMKHRMRAYQAFFHVNPDYAYWYGWAMLTKDLGEIKEMAKTMRAVHGSTKK